MRGARSLVRVDASAGSGGGQGYGRGGARERDTPWREDATGDSDLRVPRRPAHLVVARTLFPTHPRSPHHNYARIFSAYFAPRAVSSVDLPRSRAHACAPPRVLAIDRSFFLWATTFVRRCALGGRREGGAGSSLARMPLATCVPTPYRGGCAPVRTPSARPLARRPRVRVCVSCVVRYRCILSDSLMLSCSLVLVPHRWSSVHLRTSPMARHHHSTRPPPASRSRLHPPAQPLSGSTDFGIQFI